MLQQFKIRITVFPPGAKAVVKMSWAAVNVSGTYEADLNIFGHTIVGSGSISGDLSKLDFELHLKLRAGLNGTIDTSSDLDVSLGSSELLIENLTIDGHDVSGPLQQLATRFPNFLQAYGHAVDGLFEVYIVPVLQKLLNGNVSLPKIGKCGFKEFKHFQ
ncbi:uncharacterized protein [Atheta coriaria]|uniref:uncharacterized protein n=1 Tax=Dalotia coriaria TaxID=877792 RepID=UPI0031F3395F